MKRSVLQIAAAAALVALALGATSLLSEAPGAATAPSDRLEDYAVFASDLIRTRGIFTVSGLAVGVNRGSLLTHGPLDAGNEDVVAGGSNGLVRLRPGSTCGTLFASPSKVIGSSCSSSPVAAFVSPIVGDVPGACGYPAQFPTCGGADIIVGHDEVRSLAPGTYGKVLLRGAGPGASTLRLGTGDYTFCSLRVGRSSSLEVTDGTRLFIAGAVQLFPDSRVEPAVAGGSPLGAFVSGDGVRISRRASFTGRICAPNALLALGHRTHVTGSVVARVVSADREATVTGIPVATPSTTTSTVRTTTTSTAPPTTTTIVPPSTTTTTVPVPTTSTIPPPPTTTSTLPLTTTTTAPIPTTTTSTLPPTTTTTVSPTTTTSTSIPGAVCGNGIQEGDEECDVVPAIPQICTAQCKWVPAVCGDTFRQNGETCDDGNTVDGDACPSSCVINTCAPTQTKVQVTVSYARQASVSVGTITTFLDYPDGRVTIPGVGGAASVSNRITAVIPPVSTGYGDTDNDLDYAVNVLLSKTPPLATLAPGKLYTVSFDLCFNQTAPPASAFTCRVTQAVDTANNDINLTTNPMSCSVTIP